MMHTSRSSTGLVRRAPEESRCDRIELDPVSTAVRHARDWTSMRLAQSDPPHGQELIDAAVLVVSELVTNAIRAVNPPPPPPGRYATRPGAAMLAYVPVITLVISDTCQSVRIEVHDRSCVPIPPVIRGKQITRVAAA